MTYTTLLPARMGRLELRNRIVFPAMVTNYCSTRGEVTDRLVAYHQERAKGGAGLLITEATYISPDGKSFPHQLGIDDDGLLPGLRRLVESVHAAGARIAVQLCHAGRQTSRAVTGLPLLSPSVTRFGNDETSAMRQEDIDRVLRDYAGAALRAQKAGFDAVELHAGNGYLPQQFLSPFTNARQDGYGGSLENRVRFTVEAIRAVRAAVGPDFPIILRLGVAEPVSGGLTLEDGVAAARILAREDIDAFDVTAGMREGGMWVTPPLALPRGTHIEKAAAVRQAIQASRPVIGIGRITSASLADSFIAAGKVDFVVMGRALLADPELPLKTLQGREEDIRPCIGCNEGCIGRLSRGLDICCAVNPRVGNEYRPLPRRVASPRHVLIVGAGPAGLVAACTALRRGHRVTVLEKEAACGGKIPLAARPPFKEELAGYAVWLERQARDLGADIRCSTKATPSLVSELAPDVVLLAVGSEPVIPPIPGLAPERFLLAEQVLQQQGPAPGQDVLIIGGGLVGCETALFLARNGCHPLVAEMREDLCMDIEPRSRAVMLLHLKEYGIRTLTSCRVDRIGEGEAVLCRTGHAEEHLPCSRIVLATGYRPRTALAEALRGMAVPVHSIGDCHGGTRICDAVWQAAATAETI